MSKLVKGKDVILSIYDSESTAYKPVACLTENSYEVSVDTEQADPNKCDTNPPVEAGTASYEISADGVLLASDDPDFSTKANGSFLEELAWKKEKITWKISGGNEERYGVDGIVTSYSEGAPAEGNTTFSISISGSEQPVDTDPMI